MNAVVRNRPPTIYGDGEPIPASEEHPTVPLSPYGVSKLSGELYLSYYHLAFGLPYVALRYANVYGPRQSSQGEAGVVAIFISRLLAGQTPVINGDGKQTRDYVFAGDVARANLAAATVPLSAARQVDVRAFNIGTGRETSVLELAATLQRITTGSFPPAPDDVYRCETCAFAAVCRKDYVGDI